MGNAIFYDLGKQEGNDVIYTIAEWKQLITAYDELEYALKPAGILAACILADFGREALPKGHDDETFEDRIIRNALDLEKALEIKGEHDDRPIP